MATPRALLARVHKLAQERDGPLLALLGGQQGWEEFQAEADEGIATGRYDREGMTVVVAALRAWLNNDRFPT